MVAKKQIKYFVEEGLRKLHIKGDWRKRLMKKRKHERCCASGLGVAGSWLQRVGVMPCGAFEGAGGKERTARR